jgi:hypothetical protein
MDRSFLRFLKKVSFCPIFIENDLDKKHLETFEKRSILFKVKEGENFNHRHTLSIPRIKI